MESLKAFWRVIDGKKTFIGTLIFFFAMQAQSNGLVDTGKLNEINTIVEQFSTILVAVGLIHKGVKSVQK